MIGTWQNNEIEFDVPNGSHAAILVMFNGGLDKEVEIRDKATNNLIHLIRSKDDKPGPSARMLPSGQMYLIRPFYYDGIAPANDFTAIEFPGAIIQGKDAVTHRELRVTPNGGTVQKVSITIVLVDDDVSPRAGIGPQDGPKDAITAQTGYTIEREHPRVPLR